MKKLVVFGTFVAGVTVGFAACGVLVANRVLQSDRHREGLAKVVSEKVDEWLYSEEKQSERYLLKSGVSYRGFRYRTHDMVKHYKSIVFETPEEAENILKKIGEVIETYDSVSLANVYDLCGLVSTRADNDYGWNTVDGMEVVETRNGYELHLPKPKPIN